MSCYATRVVNLSAPRKRPHYFTFIPIRKLVLNYAKSPGTRPSHEMRQHCAFICSLGLWVQHRFLE
jgi:hypothetical protein